MKVFLDTSTLSDAMRDRTRDELLSQYPSGGPFYLSAITHFQILWGYLLAKMSPERYARFLDLSGLQVAPIIKADAEEAASMRPSKADALDALIAASAKRYDAVVWTTDKDFLKFLPKARVRIF
jgi:predicted nucleic acid-binding protein